MSRVDLFVDVLLVDEDELDAYSMGVLIVFTFSPSHISARGGSGAVYHSKKIGRTQACFVFGG